MKKNFIVFLTIASIVTTSLTTTSCGTQNKDTASDSKGSAQEKTTDTPNDSLETYSDDTITCTYDKKHLTYQLSKPTDNMSYGLIFDKNTNNISNDITSGNIVYFSVMKSPSIDYDESKSYLLPLIAKSTFNGLFNISDEDKSSVKNNNDIYEYQYKSDDAEYYGKLHKFNSSDMAISVCRILSGTDTDYKKALLDCFESMEYNDNDNDSDSETITSGPLYETIKEIASNVDSITKIESSYYVTIKENNPKNFLNIAKKLNKKAFNESNSVSYCMDTTSYVDAAMITVVYNTDSAYQFHSSLMVFDDKIKTKLEKLYRKDNYWHNLDLDTQTDKAFDDIVEKYSY